MIKTVLLVYLLVLSICDAKRCKVPLVWVGIGLIMAGITVIADCILSPDKWQWIVMRAMLGTLPGIFVLFTGYSTHKVGYGDGLVLMGVGILLGYRTCFLLICFSLLFMSICCILLLLFHRGNRNTKIPFLPFLTVVYAVGMLM